MGSSFFVGGGPRGSGLSGRTTKGGTIPAVSRAQQQAAGAELARRRRGVKPRLFKGMSTKDLEHFASTSTKGLPKRKKKKRRG